MSMHKASLERRRELGHVGVTAMDRMVLPLYQMRLTGNAKPVPLKPHSNRWKKLFARVPKNPIFQELFYSLHGGEPEGWKSILAPLLSSQENESPPMESSDTSSSPEESPSAP